MRYILLGLLLLLGSFTNAYVRNEEISFAMKTLRDEVIQWRQLPPRNLPQFAVDKVALNTPVLTDVAEAATTQVYVGYDTILDIPSVRMLAHYLWYSYVSTNRQFTLGDDRFLSSWLPVVQNGKALCGLTLSIDYSGSYIVDVQWFTECKCSLTVCVVFMISTPLCL